MNAIKSSLEDSPVLAAMQINLAKQRIYESLATEGRDLSQATHVVFHCVPPVIFGNTQKVRLLFTGEKTEFTEQYRLQGLYTPIPAIGASA